MVDRVNLFSLRRRLVNARVLLIETISSSPRVIAIPGLCFLVLAAVGIWALLWSSQMQEQATRSKAHAMANSTASALELMLFVNIQPAISLSVFVTQNPEWDFVGREFDQIAKGLFESSMQDGYPKLLSTILRLIPFGVVAKVMPRNNTWLSFENGTDSFSDPIRRMDLVRTAQLNTTTLAWMNNPQALYVRVPLFIHTSSQDQLWGRTDDMSMREYCTMCFRPDLGQKLWGFTAIVLDPMDIVDGNFGQLAGLADLNYAYKLYRPATVDSPNPDILIGESVGACVFEKHDMLMQPVNVPNSQWFLFIMPTSGWKPPWTTGLLAATIIASTIASILVFLLLFAIERHNVLLHSLVPKSVVERVQQGLESPHRTYDAFLNARTPADTILDIMSQLLRGVNPSIQDVILVRTAMRQSFDLYAPMGLAQHLLEATKDDNVGAALVALVGADTKHRLVKSKFPEARKRTKEMKVDTRAILGKICSVELSLQLGVLNKLEELLHSAHSWEFDVYELEKVSNGCPLSSLAFYLLHTSGLIGRFELQVEELINFLKAIEAGYSEENPYHNRRHAAYVLQSMHVIIHKGGMLGGYVDDITLLTCYLAAILHDFDHGGYTNDFLIKVGDPLALIYNDISPLENHHISLACTKMSSPSMNFLTNLEQEEAATFRKLLIELVLATDMKQHFSIVSQFGTMHRLNRGSIEGTDRKRSMLTTASNPSNTSFADHSHITVGMSEIMPLDDSERIISLQMALKLSDLGHVSAPFHMHLRWVNALEEEFFRQGDSEKACNFTVSPLFDRNKKGVTMSQIGFFDVVVLPCFKHFVTVFEGCEPILKAARDNYDQWTARAEVSE